MAARRIIKGKAITATARHVRRQSQTIKRWKLWVTGVIALALVVVLGIYMADMFSRDQKRGTHIEIVVGNAIMGEIYGQDVKAQGMSLMDALAMVSVRPSSMEKMEIHARDGGKLVITAVDARERGVTLHFENDEFWLEQQQEKIVLGIEQVKVLTTDAPSQSRDVGAK